MRDTCLGERLALARLRRSDRAGARVERMREADALRHAGGDAHGPVGARRDDPVDPARSGEPVDSLLVLRREHRALVGEREPGRAGIAVDRDHVNVATGPRGLEQAELGGPGA